MFDFIFCVVVDVAVCYCVLVLFDMCSKFRILYAENSAFDVVILTCSINVLLRCSVIRYVF